MTHKDHFISLGFGLHYENMRYLDERDILIPSIGGAGSSLLAQLISQLGLVHIDLNRDALGPNRSVTRATDSITRRIRSSSPQNPETTGLPQESTPGHGYRFAKTHLPAQEFTDCTFGGVWLLIRDPRDAMYSWYRYHRNFAEADWEKVPATFEEFLDRPFFTGERPTENWSSFYSDWDQFADRIPHYAMIKFENLKKSPVAVMKPLLRALTVGFTEEDLAHAIESSTFESMRLNEEGRVNDDCFGPRSMVMRRGMVNEWTEWMTDSLRQRFSADELTSTAQRFGYSLPD